MEAWKTRNRQAIQAPMGPERPIVRLMEAIEAYVKQAERDAGAEQGGWRDWVLGEHVGSLLDAFVGLLAGPIGNRLDAGTLDTWARRMAERIGYDMDMSEMRKG